MAQLVDVGLLWSHVRHRPALELTGDRCDVVLDVHDQRVRSGNVRTREA